MVTTLIQQVRVLDPVAQTDRVLDVWIESGQLRAIAETIAVPDDAVCIDGSGKIFAPALVDLYSHSGEPGYESRETLDSLRQSASSGGFSRVCVLPTTHPAVDNPGLVKQVMAGNLLGEPQLFVWGAATRGARGEAIAELNDLAQAGVVGFSDGQPLTDGLLVNRLVEYAQQVGKPLALCPHAPGLMGDGSAREGAVALQLGLTGDPAASETSALAALLEAIAPFPIPIHLMRISTARGVELVQQAKAKGLPITASTTWMHLCFNTQDLHTYDPNLRLTPPLGNPADQQALIEAVETGILDGIAVEHSPYTYEEKTVPFSQAPPGAIGLELVLPVLWQKFVVPEIWSPLTLWQALSDRPARCLQQTPPRLLVGEPLEALLFDPVQSWQVCPAHLKSQSANTPWYGQTVQGKVTETWAFQPFHRP
ncbi:MAG: dihydroorotase [Cyanobacteria bacterium P01_H01_bin.119]